MGALPAMGLCLVLSNGSPVWLSRPCCCCRALGLLRPGQELFSAHCAGCHAGGGNIQRRGKTLRLAALEQRQLASAEAISRIAAAGVGQMSGYENVLGEGGAEAVGQWVWSQAQAGWPQT